MSNAKTSVKSASGASQARDNNPRSYWWHSILYPDNEAHVLCLSNYLANPDGDYLYILHDADGEEKKPHWHLVQKFANPRYRNGVAKMLGIEKNLVRVAEHGQNELLYLIHADPASRASGKHLYEASEADGTLSALLSKLLSKQADSVSEEDAIPLMLDYISNFAGYLSLSAFSSWVASQHFWSFYRRSSLIFVRLIDEHNSVFTRSSPLTAKKTVDMDLSRTIQNSESST